MRDQAYRTAWGLYHVIYESKGYWFRTPEAWDVSGNFRASMYMRPAAIWAMEMIPQPHSDTQQRVSAIPGVKSATMAGSVPFLSGGYWDLSIDGYTSAGGEKFVDTNTNQVGPNYFATMQIPLLNGREFTARDTAKAPQVAVVNETLARRYIVGKDSLDKALGHILRLRDNAPIQIVGVVKDSSNGAVGEPPPPVFSLPYLQQGSSRVTLQLRTEGDPTALTSLVRQQISVLDSEVTPLSVLT